MNECRSGIKAIVADDEPHLATHLCSRLNALWPELDVIATASNGPETLTLIHTHRPDIAFLDIRMPGFSGLEVAKRLTVPCRIVFITAYDQYAVEAFEREAADYVLKPIDDARLKKTVARLRQSTRGDHDESSLIRLLHALGKAEPANTRLRWIKAQAGSAIRLLSVDEVCYFQATDKYTAVVTRDAELLIRTSIKELIEQVDPEQFWQIHRGTIVNARQIVSARHDPLGRIRLNLRDRSEAIPVSRSYAHLFKQM